jgi:hypothetical protein
MEKAMMFDLKKVNYLMVKGVKTKVEDAEIFQFKGKQNRLDVIVSKTGEILMSKCANEMFVSIVMNFCQESGLLEASLEYQHGGRENLLKYLDTKS